MFDSYHYLKTMGMSGMAAMLPAKRFTGVALRGESEESISCRRFTLALTSRANVTRSPKQLELSAPRNFFFSKIVYQSTNEKD